MVKVSVLYPNRADTKFDMTYYLNQHIAMVRQLLGSALKGVSVEQGISGEEPGSPAPYVTTCHLLFDSVLAFQTSFGPHAQEIMGEDIDGKKFKLSDYKGKVVVLDFWGHW